MNKMSKPKIKFKLIKLERALVFQVLEQDERFRQIDRFASGLHYISNGGLSVSSVDAPDLRTQFDTVFLRGSFIPGALDVATAKFDSNDDRDKFFTRVLNSLRDWSQNAPQFAEDKQVAQPTEPDTYHF